MPKSFLVKKKTERYKKFPSAQIVSSPGNGFVRELNQISAIQSGLITSVQESTLPEYKIMEPCFKIVCEPKISQVHNQILSQPFINNKTPAEPQNRGGDHCFVKKALVASTNASGLESASGNILSDGKIKQLSNKNQCQHCKKSYTSLTNLLRHQQFHCSPHQKKPFHCKHCEKLYVSLGALKMHIRTHTLPCKCKICGKAFSRPWLLQGHIRTHTGEKPYKCNQCQRAFADRSNLRAHLQTHSDVKKYCCSRCSKSFSRMSLLNKHVDSCQVFLQNTSTL